MVACQGKHLNTCGIKPQILGRLPTHAYMLSYVYVLHVTCIYVWTVVRAIPTSPLLFVKTHKKHKVNRKERKVISENENKCDLFPFPFHYHFRYLKGNSQATDKYVC